jgi:hypothetical protein
MLDKNLPMVCHINTVMTKIIFHDTYALSICHIVVELASFVVNIVRCRFVFFVLKQSCS